MIRVSPTLLAALCSIGLSGCGTYVPHLHEAWEEADINDDLAHRIKKSIYCELRLAVAAEGNKIFGYRGVPVDAIPDNWGAQTTITLKVDETGAVNPGVTLNKFFRNAFVPHAGQQPITVGQTFNLGIGGVLSSQAARTDTYYSFFNLKDMKKPLIEGETTCEVDRHGSSPLLSGDLGIRAWLKGALMSQNALPSSPLPRTMSSKLDILQYQVQFVVITTGTVNPIWKLAAITANSGNSPLVSANRTRTNTFILTMGPTTIVTEPVVIGSKAVRTVSEPSRPAADLHFSAQIGQAVANGIRSGLQ